MNQGTKLIKSPLGLLKLAEHLNNVTKACKLRGTSLDSFYRIKELNDTGGEAALVEINPRKHRLLTELLTGFWSELGDLTKYKNKKACKSLILQAFSLF